MTAVRLRHLDEPFPGGQSYTDVVEQMRSLLGDVRAHHDSRRVLLIGHSANLWALEHVLGGMPLEELVAGPFAWREGWSFRLET